LRSVAVAPKSALNYLSNPRRRGRRAAELTLAAGAADVMLLAGRCGRRPGGPPAWSNSCRPASADSTSSSTTPASAAPAKLMDLKEEDWDPAFPLT